MHVNNIDVNTTFPEESRRRNVPRPAVSQPASKPELERERERGLTVVYGTSSAVGGASVVQSV